MPFRPKRILEFREDLSFENGLSTKIDASLLALGKSIYYEITELLKIFFLSQKISSKQSKPLIHFLLLLIPPFPKVRTNQEIRG